jgi:hypothetical protein
VDMAKAVADQRLNVNGCQGNAALRGPAALA